MNKQMTYERLMIAIEDLNEMLDHLVKNKYAEYEDGLELNIQPEGTCDIAPIGWNNKRFDSVLEFVYYMEGKKWKKEYK